MNYIYGCLNQELISVDYEGLTTETAQVVVDNDARTIAVNVTTPATPITSNTLMPLLQAGQNIMLTNINNRVRIDCVIPEGPQGEQGVGVEDLNIKSINDVNNIITYEMTSTLTNGTTIKVGEFNVQQGSIGPAGKDGLNGQQGLPGEPGLNALTCSAKILLTEEPTVSQIISPIIPRNSFNRTPLIKDTFLVAGEFNSTNYLLNVKIVNIPGLDSNGDMTFVDGIEITSILPLGFTPIQFVKLDNGSTSTAVNGILTKDQLTILQANDNNYIMLANEKYYLSDKEHEPGNLTYTHVGHSISTGFIIKAIDITINNKSWVLNSLNLNQ